MLTVSGSGTLAELHDLAARWRTDSAEDGPRVVRVKIEAAPPTPVPAPQRDERGTGGQRHSGTTL